MSERQGEFRAHSLELLRIAYRCGKYLEPSEVSHRLFAQHRKTVAWIDASEVKLVGDLGLSASVGPWMYEVLHQAVTAEKTNDHIFGIYLIHVPQYLDHRLLGHNIFGLAIGRWNSLLCGGMTDYSGEGGYARQMVSQFLQSLRHELGIDSVSCRMEEEEFESMFASGVDTVIEGEFRTYYDQRTAIPLPDFVAGRTGERVPRIEGPTA